MPPNQDSARRVGAGQVGEGKKFTGTEHKDHSPNRLRPGAKLEAKPVAVFSSRPPENDDRQAVPAGPTRVRASSSNFGSAVRWP
jgi:hypothetical protein